MRKFPVTVAVVLIAGVVAPGTTATKRAVLPPPLLPLSDKDMYSTGETGCQTAISQGKDTFIFIVGDSMILRTAAGPKGLQVCKPDDVTNWDDSGRAAACGGRKLSMRHVGKAIGHQEADSVEGNGVLTMSDGKNSRTVKVQWGTAC